MIYYKNRLSGLKKGGQPCYQAVVQSKVAATRSEFVADMASRSGFTREMASYFLDVFVASLRRYYRLGKRVNLGPLSSGVAVQGSVKNPNTPWNKSAMKLMPYLNLNGDLLNCLADEVGKNVTNGVTASLTSVLDTVHAVNWSLIGASNVLVHVIGLGLEVDVSAEDEGVYLENEKGVVVAKATVTAATDTTLDCTFAELPPDGRYRFVVATRNGLGDEFGVTLAKHWVTVRARMEEV